MCAPIAGMMGAGGLLENLGDPLGTRKRREDQQQSAWAREDRIRDATFAHEKEMAGLSGGSNSAVPNRSSLGVQGGQGGNKSRYNPGRTAGGQAK